MSAHKNDAPDATSVHWSTGYTHGLRRWRWLVLLLSLFTVLGLGSGARFLGFANNYRIFFSDENPDLLAFEELQNVYTKNDNVLIAIAPKNGQVFSPQVLKAIQKITEDGWKTPYSSRVDSITNFQYSRSIDDDLIVNDLVERPDALSTTDLDKIKEIVVNEPLLYQRLISKNTQVTAVNITVELPEKDPLEVFEVSNYAHQKVAEYRVAYPEIDFYISGVILLNNAFASASQKDMGTLVPLMYLLILAMLAFLLKSFSGTFSTLIIILFSVVSGMGFAGWMGFQLTPPSSIAPTVILTLAVADSVHLLVNMLKEMRKGRSKMEALAESLRLNFQPIFLTSLTTAIGFLSLNFSDQPPYHHLGNITAFGVMMAFLFTITLLPVLVTLLPFKTKLNTQDTSSHDSHFFSHLAEFVLSKKRPLFVGSLITVIGLSAMVPSIELNDEFVQYFSKAMAFRNDTDYITKNLTGIYQIHYNIKAKDSGGISDPHYLKKLDEFATWFRQHPQVIHVNTLTDTMKRLNKNMHGDDPAWYKLPDSRELAAQYLLLYEMSLPYGLDLNNQINIDKSSTRFTVTLQDTTAKDMRDLSAQGENWLKTNAPAHMSAIGSGPALMFSKISKRNIRSMALGFLLALTLITLVLIFALRSLHFGLLSIIPNVVPISMGMGIWALIEGQAGTAISIVASVTIGIVVDDTIHFLSKYVRAKRENRLSSDDSIRYAFQTVGPALFVTSVVLIIGFSVLTASHFRLNWTLGFLSAVTLALALAADFIFLPSMMSLFGGKKREAQ